MADFLGTLSNLFSLKGAKCAYCGRDIPAGSVCGNCGGQEEALFNKKGFLGSLLYVFDYGGVVRKMIHNFKYNDMPYLGAYMAAKMHERLLELRVDFDLITFVPVHENRLRWRGFDQAEMLAGYLSAQTGVPYQKLLSRTRDTVPQFDLGREERKKNVKGAFCAAGPLDLAGKKVLLVDDVCTTGSTLRECAGILEKAGATMVLFTFARES